MNPEAIVMLIVATGTVWGGLALAIWHLARHPEEPDEEGEPSR